MGESYGRNGATILASGRYRLDWLGATYSGSGQYIGSSDVVATSWDRRGIYCAANSQSAFFNFSVNGPPDTTLTWAEVTPGGIQFTFRLLAPSGAPIDLGQTRQRDSIL